MLAATVPPNSDTTTPADRLRTRTANVCLMRLLERIATRFNQANVPLMALKGAALNLTIYDQPDHRPMADLDLMVKPEDAETAVRLLEELGCRPGRPLMREDFFPRFHYETELIAGHIYPMRIDLHVRPLRPLCYARRVDPEALWRGAEVVQAGRAEVLIPSLEDMLIHLAAHSSVHANIRPLWLADIKIWADAWRDRIDWDRFLEHVRSWGLVLPVRQAIARTEEAFGEVCPPEVRVRLLQEPVTWRDRLALRQAPRDAEHPAAHVLVDAVCTPGWWFVLCYLWAVLIPDRRHMGGWYSHRHWGWLPWAHVLRLVSPVLRRIPRLWTWFARIEVRESRTRAPGVFATRVIGAGERIAQLDSDAGAGKLRYLNHSCHPNAERSGCELLALKAICVGDRITIDCGTGACECRRDSQEGTELLKSA
ncbi:MAG: nucleotidyltransferase family protein [Phycisphaerae bacterium]|nr:nucleotidyltransferase family protein [Phycisphaerae bacterium]